MNKNVYGTYFIFLLWDVSVKGGKEHIQYKHRDQAEERKLHISHFGPAWVWFLPYIVERIP